MKLILTYVDGAYKAIDESEYLAHYGRKGMKWGEHLFNEETGELSRHRGFTYSDKSYTNKTYEKLNRGTKKFIQKTQKYQASVNGYGNKVVKSMVSGDQEKAEKYNNKVADTVESWNKYNDKYKKSLYDKNGNLNRKGLKRQYDIQAIQEYQRRGKQALISFDDHVSKNATDGIALVKKKQETAYNLINAGVMSSGALLAAMGMEQVSDIPEKKKEQNHTIVELAMRDKITNQIYKSSFKTTRQ